ncbi:MAG: sugar ABC transporter ATP-binding protein [Chloroflexi bacterium]|nr:sugar ABC transporter ATP-binding protein [Chloroflexota bacterium]
MGQVNETILEMRGISKSFPGVKALDDVSFVCKKGEVHALVGENGAGKSTLMKILAGAYQPDQGEILLKGSPVAIHDPLTAQRLGISIIYQEFNLVPYLNVEQNVFLGREPRDRFRFVDSGRIHSQSAELLERLDIALDTREQVNRLSVAEQQMVEIAKALSLNAEILIMDEPTAALGEHEQERLFQLMNSLKERGMTIIYISHRLEEIFQGADRATVLKDGKVMGSHRVDEIDRATLVKMMVGRTLEEIFPAKTGGQPEEVLRVEGISRRGVLRDVSFSLQKGEILGIAGLIGSGRTELVRSIFCADPRDSGDVYLEGNKLNARNPRDCIKAGLCLAPEDRKNDGLVLGLSVQKNITIPILEKIRRWAFVHSQKEREIATSFVTELNIRTPSAHQEVQYLSGGNQQKVVLAKWLAAEPKVIIFDEPTRGIDVGAKQEIYQLMRDLANRGTGILMISSELPEVLGMSDRILVMQRGAIAAEFLAAEATEERIVAAATGLKDHHETSNRLETSPSQQI